jgi:hypothetical protein
VASKLHSILFEREILECWFSLVLNIYI